MKYPLWRLLDPSVRLELRFPRCPAAPPQGEVLDLSKRSYRTYTCEIRGKKVFSSQWDGPSDSSVVVLVPWTVGFPHTASEQRI